MAYPHAVRSLAHRDFRRFWRSAAVSNAGSQMQLAALGWVVAEATHNAVQVAVIGFAGTVPFVALSVVGGALADRVPRRNLLLVSQSVQMAQAVGLLVAWQLDVATYPVLVAFAVGNGVAAAMGQPAWGALLPELVPPDALPNAVMLNSAQFNLARAVGPMVAGGALALVGAGVCFLLNGLSFLAVIGVLVRMSAGRTVHAVEGPRGFRKDLGAALRYIAGHRGLRTALSTNAFVGLVGAPIAHLIAIVAVDVYEVGPGAYGVLAGALGAGAVLGAVVVGQVDGRWRPSRIVTFGLGWYAVSFLALAQSGIFAVAVAAMLVVGAGYLAVLSTSTSAIQRLCDDAMRGRVLAVWLTAYGAALPVGVIVQGTVAERFGSANLLRGDALLLALCALFVRRRMAVIDPVPAAVA